jgi:hypothetical protein
MLNASQKRTNRAALIEALMSSTPASLRRRPHRDDRVTNHGPRGVSDSIPYNHYSLLRTIEDAFGIHDYLALGAASGQGVKPRLPLFSTR